MFKGFKSTEDMLSVIRKGGSNTNVQLRIEAFKEIKARLGSPVHQNGLEALRSLASDIFGQGREINSLMPGFDLTEALTDIAYEACEGAEAPLHRQLIVRFMEGLDLLKGPAKNTEAVEIANSQIAPETQMPDEIPAGNENAKDTLPKTKIPEGTVSRESYSRFSPDSTNGHEEYQIDTNIETSEESPWDLLQDYTGPVIEVGFDGAQDASVIRINPGELMKLPGILPPPPELDALAKDRAGEAYGKWLEGDIWHPLSFSLKLHLRGDDNADDLIEMLSEFHALPETACSTYNARQPSDAEAGRSNAINLINAGNHLGFYGHTVQMAAEELSKSIMRYLEEFEPRSAEFLTRVGFDVRCDPQLAAVLSQALDVERFFIDTGPRNASEGRLNDIRGSIGMDCRLDVPQILDRAVFCYFIGGEQMADSIVQTLNELRHAQLCRHIGRDVSTVEFDAIYSRDWFLELDEYNFEREVELTPM